MDISDLWNYEILTSKIPKKLLLGEQVSYFSSKIHFFRIFKKPEYLL